MSAIPPPIAGPLRISRTARRHARIVVSPGGDVDVRVPLSFTDTQLNQLLTRRSEWITRQRVHFDRYRPREPKREYVGGESIRYLGRQYRLKVLSKAPTGIRATGRRLIVNLPDSTD